MASRTYDGASPVSYAFLGLALALSFYSVGALMVADVQAGRWAPLASGPASVDTVEVEDLVNGRGEPVGSFPGRADRVYSVNAAPVDSLVRVPGVGPVLAERIIAGRPFLAVDSLVTVRGIGEKSLARMRPHLSI